MRSSSGSTGAAAACSAACCDLGGKLVRQLELLRDLGQRLPQRVGALLDPDDEIARHVPDTSRGRGGQWGGH